MGSEELEKNWNDVCAQIKSYEGVDPTQIDAFFSRIEPQAMSEGFLMLTADNDFIKQWVTRHYCSFIERALTDLYHVPFTVDIEVNDSDAPAAYAAHTDNVYTEKGAANTQQASAQSTPVSNSSAKSLSPEPSPTETPQNKPELANMQEYKPDYGEDFTVNKPLSTFTFENFVIGDSNRMAYSMAVNVAETPGETPLNPLFIYGKSGLGKTHLMRAIQNYISETQPQLKTVYVDSAELLSDYTEAVAAYDREKSSYKNFKTHYEEADVLLIDDIQYLQGRKQTLDMVFQIFNKLIDMNHQIVLSADRAPKNIDIDERYYSRFNQGGTVDIQPPEIETKLGIIKVFVEDYRRNGGLNDFQLSDSIQMYIAENSSSNIRELKSAVTKVVYRASLTDAPELMIDDVRLLLENHFSGGGSKNLTVEDVQKEIESFFKVKHSDLVGSKRARSIVYPRQIAIYLCRQLLDLPFNDIGKKFNRDHSTIMHSVTAVEEMMRTNREVQEEIDTLKQIIREL